MPLEIISQDGKTRIATNHSINLKENIINDIKDNKVKNTYKDNNIVKNVKAISGGYSIEEKDFSKIEMISQKKDRDINVKFEMKEKKKFYINNIPVKKTSEIIGKTYIVLFTPEDIGIINNEPSKRRRFLNIMISQLRPVYINLLSEYNKILEQRNFYLKQIKYEGKSVENLYIWDEQIAKIGQKIYEYRKEFIEKINNKIYKIHLNTTENKEEIKMEYFSNIRKKLFRKFEKKSKK